jgi:hypothetical protein
LDSDTDRAVAHVAVLGFNHRVVVHVNNLVQVVDNNLSDLMKLLEVVLSFLDVDETRESKRRQIADSDLVRGRIFNDLRAQIGAADGSKILLVALAVASVLVQHVRITSLSLSLENAIPELLSTNGVSATALSFVARKWSVQDG